MHSPRDILFRLLRRAGTMAPVVILLGTGCAPTQFADGVSWTIRRTHTGNARAQFVEDHPSLRFNTWLVHELLRAEGAKCAENARASLLYAVDEAHDLAVEVYTNELDRLPAGYARKLLDRYFSSQDHHADPRGALRSRFIRVINARHKTYREYIASMAELRDLQRAARSLRRACLHSPKDHHGGRIATGLVAALTKEDRGPLDRGGPDFDLYSPGSARTAEYVGRNSDSSSPESAWLSRYAPIIVQERIADADYSPDTDQIGTIRLEGKSRAPGVIVDISKPSIYAYRRETLVGGERRVQLTYTYWFPRHPKLKSGDPEAGKVEGDTLRITLDAKGRPMLFETVLNCGCYHRCYPSSALEAAACEAYGGPVKGKRFCVERKVPGRIDWIVPEVVEVSGDSDARPILYSRAGYHGPAGITFDRNELDARTILAEKTYDLRSYDELERLPTEDGFASMFLDNGLVRGAERMEGKLLAFTGMLSAGQPRQRGTQLLHWDQYDFDDPHLLETCLRIPPGF